MPFSTLSGFEHAAEAEQREQKVAAKKKHTETMLGKSREKCRVTDKSCQIGGRKKKKEKKEANE